MKNSLDYQNNIIKEINHTIFVLTEQSDEDNKKGIQKVLSDIADLRKLINKQKSFDLDFSKIWIKFLGEYELKLPKYGLESFDRVLKDRMYFKVLGGTKNYIDIKTNSFPETFRIRLYYDTLDVYENQTKDAFLIYQRGSDYLKGDETKISYSIIKKS